MKRRDRRLWLRSVWWLHDPTKKQGRKKAHGPGPQTPGPDDRFIWLPHGWSPQQDEVLQGMDQARRLLASERLLRSRELDRLVLDVMDEAEIRAEIDNPDHLPPGLQT